MSFIDDKVHLLLVDDREDGLIALEALLGQNPGYGLVMARSGAEALSLLPKQDFALILLDVQMPGLDGFQTAELIRKQERFSRIPILFVSAINKDDRYVLKGYETGAVDYIFKPFDPAILTSKVSVFADLWRQRRTIERQSALLREQEERAHADQIEKLELTGLKRFQFLADSIPHMVWEATPEGQILYHNRQAEAYTGRTLEQCQGMGWHESFNARDLKEFLVKWMQALQTRSRFEIEARIRCAEGQERWHLVRVVPDLDAKGNVKSWIGTCTDIQERKSMERQLLEAQRKAEAASEAKSQFLANMSHEIRTPLNAIMGFTDLLLEPDVTPSDRINSLSIVRRNSQQLLKIIDEILDISKVEAGGLELEMTETDVVALVSGVRSLLQVNAAKKKVRLDFSVEGQIPGAIVTDATRLRQILVNLVGNAIKFTGEGKVDLVARAVDHASGKRILQFEIRDSGAGVDPALSEKIFLPFLQADSSTTRLYGGTGLGLALSRKLARALGGDVWLERSEIGKGSVFIAEVALDPAAHAAVVTSFSDLSWDEVDPREASPESVLSGARILLAEDAEENQILISHFLGHLGAIIDLASNGTEAVEKAMANEYSAVLMDIQMPFLDGYEATSRLRQGGYRRPIIALTAHALPEEREKCLRSGCDDHLTKPVDRRRLVESLVHHVRTRH